MSTAGTRCCSKATDIAGTASAVWTTCSSAATTIPTYGQDQSACLREPAVHDLSHQFRSPFRVKGLNRSRGRAPSPSERVGRERTGASCLKIRGCQPSHQTGATDEATPLRQRMIEDM